MAGNLQLYAILLILADGNLLAEEVQVTINRTSNAQVVNTVAKGYAGESPGAPMVEIDIDNAIPQNGFEFDAGKKITGLITTDLVCYGPGGSQLKARGFIYADTIKHGVNQEASYSFRMRAPITLFA